MLPLFNGQIEVHQLSWTREVVGGSVLDVESLHLPCGDSCLSKDLSVHGGEFGPLEVGAIDVEGILLPSTPVEEDFSWCALIFFVIDSGVWGCDIFGDVGADSNLLRDVSLDEGIGVGVLHGIVV